MKRREFLKLIGIAPVVPSILAAKKKPKYNIGIDPAVDPVNEYTGHLIIDGGRYIERPIGFALEDIPKDGYGWVQIPSNYFYCDISTC